MKIFQVIPILALVGFFSSCSSVEYAWKTDSFELSVNQKGYVNKLINTETNLNYIVEDSLSPLIQLRKNGEFFSPEIFEPDPEASENTFLIHFGNIPTVVKMKIEQKNRYIRLELLDLLNSEDVEIAVWGPYSNIIAETIGEIVGVVRDSEFAIGIQALNIKTLGGFPSSESDIDKAYDIFETNSIVDVSDSIKVLYRGQTAMRTASGSVLQAYVRDRSQTRIISNWNHEKYVAPAFNDGGIPGTAIALFGCNPNMALETIGVIELEEDLPHPIIDNEWGKKLWSATASYLIMSFGEEDLERAMNLTQKAGLKYLYHSDPFKNWGHFDLREQAFPDNWESMARCVARAEEKGLRLGVHTLSNFITTSDPYVTPVPDPRLAQVGAAKISEDVGINQSEIIIDDPDFFNQMKNNTLHAAVVNGEIIRYREISSQSPWTLLDCERGAFGTTPGEHKSGDTIAKLMDHGYKTFLTDADLSKEVALTIADLFNETGLRQISFDGLEGNWSTGMGQYGRQLFVKYWYDALSPDLQGKIITDASNPGHYFWHMYTRMNWGEPWYAGFRESQTQYRLLNQAFYQRNLMPSMLGWFRMTPQISLEDIEWLLARSAGFDAGFALVTSPEIVENHGMGDKILNTIKIWEEARMAGVFTSDLKPDLQDISKEFHLETNGPGAYNLYFANLAKANYKNMQKQPGEPHNIIVELNNENPEQPVSLLISSPSESGLSDIQIEIDNYRKVLLPLNLPPDHHIRYTGGSYVDLYDKTWNKIDSQRIIQDHMTIGQGKHTFIIEGEFTGTDGEVKIEFRTLSPPTLLTK